MRDWLDSLLPTEAISAAIAGLVLLGIIIRQAVKGWLDARAQAAAMGSNAAAMVGAVSIGFERDQRELMLQYLERIAKAQEEQAIRMKEIAGVQLSIADKHRIEQDEKLDEILARLDEAEQQTHPPSRRR